MESSSNLETPSFKVDDRVFAPDERGHLYLALIKKIKYETALIEGQYRSTWMYLVRFVGWSSTHDVWVRQNLIHVESEEIRIKAERDREACIQQQKLIKRKGLSEQDRNGDIPAYRRERGTKKKKQEKETITIPPQPSAKPITPSLVRQTTYSQALVPQYILQRCQTRRPSTKTHLVDVAISLMVDENESTQPHNLTTIEDQDMKKLCARFIPHYSISNFRNGRKIYSTVTATSIRESASTEALILGKNHRLPSKADGGSESRRSRVFQRQMLKTSSSSLGKSDTNPTTELVGCEGVLRFDKSKVHGWGVYPTELIKAGQFIVEYRGILIGNAVSDKREKIYQRAKIGSDYMFRLDADAVVDATEKGNIARYINASCNPNCFTKISSIDGVKKIGIYAKRDIRPGEELNYDYKFAHEKDESKRIPCRCGSTDCRGFMNWDPRYVMKK